MDRPDTIAASTPSAPSRASAEQRVTRSLRRDIATRLLSAVVVVLVILSAIAALVITELNQASAKRKLVDAEAHFALHTAIAERDWMLRANTFRSQLEIARILDLTDARLLRANFVSYATLFGIEGAFTHALLQGADGSAIARYQTRSQQALLTADSLETSRGWIYGVRDQVLYRVIEMPVRLADGRGKVVLAVPLDRALLANLVFPNTTASLLWKGKVVVEAEPTTPEISARKATLDPSLEQTKVVPWASDKNGAELRITSRVVTPASPALAALLVVANILTVIAVGWWMLGRWIGKQVLRLGRLSEAMTLFSTKAKLNDEALLALKNARASRRDEIALLGTELQHLMVDIEQSRAQERMAVQALSAERSLNEKIIETSPIGICIYDEAGNCIAANAAIAAHIGATVEQVRAQNYRSIDSWKRHGVVELAELALASDSVCADDFEVNSSFGRKAWLGMVFCPLHISGGGGLMLMTTDITDIKRAEVALVESERKYRTLVEQAADAIFVADAKGEIIEINDAGLNILDYTREQLIGQKFEFVVADDLTLHPFAFDELLAGRTVRSERLFKRRDGTLVVVDIIARMTPDRSIIGIVRDVTERKQIEDEMAALNASLEHKIAERTSELARANTELEAFAFAVSHDLRAPLRHISGFTSLLENTLGVSADASVTGYLQRIQTSTARMEALITDLLGLSRVTAGPLLVTAIDVSSMANEIRAEFAPLATTHPVDWQIQPGIIINADGGLLRIALTNLLGNAVKYSAKTPRPKIEIGAIALTDSGVELFIKDNGAGFDMQYAHKLFQPFQRLHSAKDFDGTGVGLATVARIVYRHHGTICAEANPGLGACFTLTFPSGSIA